MARVRQGARGRPFLWFWAVAVAVVCDMAAGEECSNSVVAVGDDSALRFLNAFSRSYGQMESGFSFEFAKKWPATAVRDLAEGCRVHMVTTKNAEDLPDADGGLAVVPLVGTAVAPVFNVDGVTDLTLSAPVLRAIVSGNITHWDAPAVAALNPDVSLPHARVTVIRDTTSFGGVVDLLEKVTEQTSTVGESVEFIDISDGSAIYFVEAVPNSIYFASFSEVAALGVTSIAKLRNRHGYTVELSRGSVNSAMQSYSAGGTGYVYPTEPSSWFLTYQIYIGLNLRPVEGVSSSCSTMQLALMFVNYLVNDPTLDMRAGELGYARLPSEAAVSVQESLQGGFCGGHRMLRNVPPLFSGKGATFPAAVYRSWSFAFISEGGAQVIYTGVGSGAGQRAIIARDVEFAGSDALLSDAQYEAGGDLQLIPMLAGGVVLFYNVPGLPSRLHLSREVVADIFLGRISKWSDPRIVRDNPASAAFLDAAFSNLTVVVRKDKSGTTEIFTRGLASVSDEWAATVGVSSLPSWPAIPHLIADEDVLSTVATTAFSLGYITLGDALQGGFTTATTTSKNGMVIDASGATIGRSLEGTIPVTERLEVDVSDRPGAWPFSGVTYMIVRMHPTERCEVMRKVLEFVHWGLTSPSASALALELGFSTMPPSFTSRYLTGVLKNMTCGGSPLMSVCPAGLHPNVESFKCECPAGFFIRSSTEPCVPCPVGSYSAVPDSAQCSPCPAGFFSDEEGAALCQACPYYSSNAEGGTSLSGCMCVEGYYLTPNAGMRECLQCPQGGTCPGGESLPLPHEGYWVANNSVVIIQCREKAACPGGGPEVCAQGFDPTSITCSECTDGFYLVNRRCHQCPESEHMRNFGAVVFLASFSLGLFLVFYFNLITVAVTTSFMQATTILRMIDVPWPTPLQDFMVLLSPVNWFLRITQPECSVPLDYYVVWALRTTSPIVTSVAIGIALVLFTTVKNLVQRVRGAKTASLRHALFCLFPAMNSAFMIQAHIFFSHASLEFFDCRTLEDGTQVLSAAPNNLCYEGTWLTLLPVAVLMLFINFVVYAVLGMLLLGQVRKHRYEVPFQQLYGFVFLRYVDRMYWWETVVLLRKVFVFIVVLFASSVGVITAVSTAAVFLLFMVVQIIFTPYVLPVMNAVESFLIVVDASLCAAAVHFASLPEGSSGAITTILTGVCYLALAACLSLNVLELFWKLGFSFPEKLLTISKSPGPPTREFSRAFSVNLGTNGQVSAQVANMSVSSLSDEGDFGMALSPAVNDEFDRFSDDSFLPPSTTRSALRTSCEKDSADEASDSFLDEREQQRRVALHRLPPLQHAVPVMPNVISSASSLHHSSRTLNSSTHPNASSTHW